MIYFKDDSSLNIKTVKTFNGKKEYRKNCKRIKNEYYVIDKDCFEVENKWYRIDSGLITFDYEAKKWILSTKKGALLYGIAAIENDKVIMGYFSPNVYNNCSAFTKDEGKQIARNALELAENGFIENLSKGEWYKRNEITAGGALNCSKISNQIDYTRQGYNIEDNALEFVQKIELFKNYDMRLSKDVRRYAKFLNDTTFGIEIEAAQGYLPPNVQNKTGVVICRDGSLDGGPEFVTVPMQGAKGLQNLNILGNELSRRSNINLNCSLHVHLGNLPTSRLFLVSLYQLCLKIQDEVFEMFPGYKVQWQGIKKKDYCAKLPKKFGTIRDITREKFDDYVNESYQKIFVFLTEGIPAGKDYNRENKNHPAKQKWERHSRYFWLNFMNTIFSERNTVEFRLHTPTTNSQKMINWLFICNAIVRYALLHPRDIIASTKKISFAEVLDYYGNTFNGDRAKFLSEYLKAYVAERTKLFKKDIERGDLVSQWELKGDKDYIFKYQNTSHLF